MKDFYVDGKKYHVSWAEFENPRGEGWWVWEDTRNLSYDSFWFIRGSKDMPAEKITEGIRLWQKLKEKRYENH